MEKKSQSSIEYMVIVAFGLFVLIPVIIMFYTYSESASSDVSLIRLNNIGTTIINNAESIYYLGEPSRVTIKVNFPNGVEGITTKSIEQVHELIFNVTGASELAFSSNVNISGTFNDQSYSPGDKNVELIAHNDFVEIIII